MKTKHDSIEADWSLVKHEMTLRWSRDADGTVLASTDIELWLDPVEMVDDLSLVRYALEQYQADCAANYISDLEN
jgi:hypothetical protein